MEAVASLLEPEDPILASLTEHVLVDVDDADIERCGPETLASAVVALRRFAEQRLPGTAVVRVCVPSPEWPLAHAAAQVVTDDMVFLVDSVGIAIRRSGVELGLVVHPVLDVRRDESGMCESVAVDGPGSPESWMHVELDRVPTDTQVAAIEAAVRIALADVRVAVADWSLMRTRTREVAHELNMLQHRHRQSPGNEREPGREAGGSEHGREAGGSEHGREAAGGKQGPWNTDPSEAWEFLGWLLKDHFTFLGAIDHDLVNGELIAVEGSGRGVLRPHEGGTPINEILAPSADWPAADVILITKTIALSTVHKRGNYDIVITKRYNDAHEVIGEHRIVGLFTSEAHIRNAGEIPLLRTKIASVFERSGFDESGHSGKELRSILASHPREELFASSVEELFESSMGILAMGVRGRTRLFARYDSQRSAWCCLVYLPRDRFSSAVRERIQRILERELSGTEVAVGTSTYNTQVSDSRLARISIVVPAIERIANVDIRGIEAQLVEASQSWSEGLVAALQAAQVDGATVARFEHAFPAAYTAETPLPQAVADAEMVDRAIASSQLLVRVHRNTDEDVESADARLSLYAPGGALALADLMPVLANLGLRVIDEKADEVQVGDNSVWIHDLGICGPTIAMLDPASVDAEVLCEAVREIWNGRVDNDSFNALVVCAQLRWREVNVLRFYARHARQLGQAASLEYMAATLQDNVLVARLLVNRFALMFDPTLDCTDVDRTDRLAANAAALDDALAAVPSLDHDRILRMLRAQIDASVRTNAYLDEAETLAVKFETRRLKDAPKPRPHFEIFVSSPRVEGVHLRMAPVARGGLRWSDRPEDFRTEILGLMKAQAVKNAVIVPAGAKGGFVVRKPPRTTDRAEIQAEGVACYQTFIRSLLELTDNLVHGAVVPPSQVRRLDDDDPYLVVAADKGTATFSDIANAISLDRKHWLGDAFASGGSVGYDHKAMGITARGAWESVTRHFLRMGVDITSPNALPFTVAGIGDMSGDVFGNGMLLSDRIALVAAFDHRHVFLDPTPDSLRSLSERQRLFALPRSSWDDYDRSLISIGGGVWPRTAKSIPLSMEARHVLGLDASVEELSPSEVIAAILRAPVDLLWNGGIGTYVKSSTESHASAGDRANDAVRADAAELRCRIVGEGGNLGVTQKGRIEFALRGGWINTDAIDNSAGVDTSDHEVNLKILLDPLVADGSMTLDERNHLLESLTDDVAHLVLADNIAQNRLLGNLLHERAGMVDLHGRYIDALEQAGRIERGLEVLPTAAELQARKAIQSGLTIPELAVLVAHTKLLITDALVKESLADDPALAPFLLAYFPAALSERFGERVRAHSLRSEIVATALANKVVNRNGITFVHRLMEETHAPVADVVRSHVAATAILGIDTYWDQVSALDGVVSDETQVELFLEADRAVERVSRWLLRNRVLPLDVGGAIAHYSEPVQALAAKLDALEHNVAGTTVVPGSDAEALVQRRQRFDVAGVPADVVRRAIQFEFATSLFDVVSVADATRTDRAVVADVLFGTDDALAIGVLRRRILSLSRDDHWDSLARSALRDDLAGEHLSVIRSVLDSTATHATADERVALWIGERRAAVERHMALVANTERVASSSSLASLSVILRELRTLAFANRPDAT